MQLRLIRSATLRLTCGGTELLIDPMLGTRGSIRPLGGSPGRNPTVDLPCSIDEVVDGADVLVLSHLHPDHYDDAARGVLPRNLPVLCRDGDEGTLAGDGFEQVTALRGPTTWHGVEITPTAGAHGTGSIGERMGGVIGLVLRAQGEPTVYWAGDTIVCSDVIETIERERPDVIVTHSGGASVNGTTIIMDVADTIEVARVAPWATVVAVHFEALTHCPVSRADLRAAADAAGIDPTRLLIPADGETLTFA